MVEDERVEGGLPFNLDRMRRTIALGCMDFIYLVNSSTFNILKSTTTLAALIKAFPRLICLKDSSVDVL